MPDGIVNYKLLCEIAAEVNNVILGGSLITDIDHCH